jgi:essential nuclear protein 1
MEMFMSREAPKRLTLADIIMEKLKEQENNNMGGNNIEEQLASKLDPKILQVYTKIGVLLNRYKSGRIPKAFKMIPNLSNWEEIVYLTKPEEWSSQATRQATRLFASNLNSKMAQRFYNLILLPKIRDDIIQNKKLNFHLYFSLKKALYKPAAFYKGLLLPLCESRDCTLREATVIGSLLAKVSIPILHSSAAILKIAEMEYSGACSLFLQILLNKKYALPYRVIDAVVAHFRKFIDDDRKLPLLWHQSLLVFVQRYKTDLLPDQKDIVKQVIKKQPHYYFTEEIRRELNNSKSRGDQDVPQGLSFNSFALLIIIN